MLFCLFAIDHPGDLSCWLRLKWRAVDLDKVPDAVVVVDAGNVGRNLRRNWKGFGISIGRQMFGKWAFLLLVLFKYGPIPDKRVLTYFVREIIIVRLTSCYTWFGLNQTICPDSFSVTLILIFTDDGDVLLLVQRDERWRLCRDLAAVRSRAQWTRHFKHKLVWSSILFLEFSRCVKIVSWLHWGTCTS